jgi:tryptophan synthase alpha chain
MMTNRIQKAFEKASDRKVMSLFLTAGYPTIEDTAALICGCVDAGADMIELGMPFSDPLADGPTIQQSSNIAIENGITIPVIFDIVNQVRKTSEVPIILMGYINPVIRFGIKDFCEKAAAVGVDGLIIPDLPVDEQDLVAIHAHANNLPIIHLVAPNTSDERMVQVDDLSGGFVYCVSVTGVTGAREGASVSQSVNTFIERVKKNVTKNPVLVGFGIKSKEDAALISDRVEGFIVGSALIQTIQSNYPNSDWMDQVYRFVRNLR